MKLPLAPLALAAALALPALASEPAAAQDNGGTVPEALFAGLEYRMVGPARGGRVTAVAGHKDQVLTYYMGATGGGVWKTTDAGNSWHNISDGYFRSPSIGAIRVAESDPNVVYVSTGSDGMRSNVINGYGVYKSTDAGETWTHLGLEDTGLSGAVLIHPTNPDLAYVAAIGDPFKATPERGVYRTQDGGSSWENVLFISDSSGVSDIDFAPDDPNTIYATSWRGERKPWTIISGAREGGVYRSTDGGDNWEHLTNGLPNGLRGKGDLAVSPADPNRVYVLIEAPEGEGGVYRSDDRGDTWRQITDFQPIRNRPFYYTNLEAHPTDPDILWGMAEGHWKSTDGGETWRPQPVPHGDNHDLWINPDNPDIMIQSNDGGANVSFDGGASWSRQDNQPTAELYQMDVSSDFPYRLYAGQQDNSTISVPSIPERSTPGGPNGAWEAHGGCETGPVVPKPGDPNIVYANCKGRFGLYDRRTGQERQYYVGFENLYGANPRDLQYRFQRVVPIHVSPHDPNMVYHGSQFVHVTLDGGRMWRTISPDLTAFPPDKQVYSGSPITLDITGEEHYSVLYDIQESPHEPGVIYTGANDGPIHITRDGGDNWTNVTPSMPEFGRVQNIEVSPHNPAKAYAAILRRQLGDPAPYGFKTEDYGQSWTRITTGANGIPNDYPLRVIREDPDREGLLYAGTDWGMFVSFDDGANWQSFQLNLPVSPITDIKVTYTDLQISTMGRSFWIMDDLTPLHEASRAVAESNAHMFEVKDAYRVRARFGFGASEPWEPEYPTMGANIDYYFGSAQPGEVTLEIMDDDGELVRRFSSEGPGETTTVEPSMREMMLVTMGTPRLPKGAGAHRFTWDLLHPGPWAPNPGQAGRRGPMVAPGTYHARITSGSWSETKSFEVMMDPRVVDAGITYREVIAQRDLAIEVRDALSEARMAAAELVAAQESGRGGERTQEALAELREKMITAPVRYSRPMLVDQLSYLYGNLLSADQEPGMDAFNRYTELRGMLDDYQQQLERLLRSVTQDR